MGRSRDGEKMKNVRLMDIQKRDEIGIVFSARISEEDDAFLRKYAIDRRKLIAYAISHWRKKVARWEKTKGLGSDIESEGHLEKK